MTPPKTTSAVDGNIKKHSRFHSIKGLPCKEAETVVRGKLDGLAIFYYTNLPSMSKAFLP